MKTGIAIAAVGIFAFLGLRTLAVEGQAKPSDRSALQREVDRRKSELAEAKEDLKAARQGEISLRLTEDEQKIEHFGRPPEYKFRSEDAKTDGIIRRKEVVRRSQEAYRLALAKLASSMTADAQSAAKAFEKGKSSLDQKDFRSAISAFSDAIRLDPRHAEAYYLRALTYAKSGRPSKAIADANEAVRLNPKYELAFYLRGILYAGKGELDKAIADFTEAIRLAPKHALAYRRRGMAYEKKGNKPQAEKDYAQAKKLERKGQ
jgi:tetratricopeptide (TPR) repeat protein